MSTIRTRFAPSPTGTPESIHLGFVIRALWNYAFAKKHAGQFILRIEDTDKERSRKDTEEEIYSVLKKFGILWDEGPDIGGLYAPYRQSERLSFYQKAAHKLVERGYAYYDFDAQKREKEEIKSAYESDEKLKELKVRPKAREENPDDALKRVEKGETYVVRVKIPEDKKFEYKDWILKKKVVFVGKEVPDMILLKSDGFPTYHLAVVVDDIEMKISHVFRGQEWISSTPIHLFLYEGLGQKVPEIGHFSVILDPRTGKKFSKRDMTAMFGVRTWLNKGYLPEAILNYLMLLGWAPKDNRELFTLREFIQAFDQEGVQKANPTFNEKKLDWFNQHYIQQKFNSNIEAFEKYIGTASVYRDNLNFTNIVSKAAVFMPSRITTIADFDKLAGFLFDRPKVEIELFGNNYKNHLKAAKEAIQSVKEWSLENLNTKLIGTAEKSGFNKGDFFMSLRVAVAGSKFTPPINESIIILGKEETLKRINEHL